MVQVIEREEHFLKDNPDHMVMYHTAEYNSLQLYCFINVWVNMLREQPIGKLSKIEEMRLFDFMKTTFEDMDIFLRKMRRRRQNNVVFNDTPGFAERAAACNPSLISNAHSTASCTMWWAFNAKNSTRFPADKVITEMLKILGIYSPERLARYLQYFERALQKLQVPQALLQQMFVPYHIANKAAYMCQIWGEEFSANDMELNSPEIIRMLIDDPFLFEQCLRDNKTAFTNFGDCPGFGDTDSGFNYANAMQHRYILRNDPEIVTHSYFRSDEEHHVFVAELTELVEEDYADYLAFGAPLPDFILAGAEATKKLVYSRSGLAFFTPNKKPNAAAFYKQQEQLFEGLVQNPCKKTYGGIVALDKATKTTLQEQLWAAHNDGPSSHTVYPYSLCKYLKGYTYFDLIEEAARAILLTPFIGQKFESNCRESLAFVLEMVETFSIPAAVRVEISGDQYLRLFNILRHKLDAHKFDSDKHSFMFSKTNNKRMTVSFLWTSELENAVSSVLRIASIAKENFYGHSVSSREMALY